MSRSKKVTSWFTALVLFHIAALSFWSCSKTSASVSAKKVIVIGFDGIDPQLLQKLMDQGRLPNFSKLAEQGDFKTLGTSIPPQSPVAWSNFITGMNPGGHGIFDFLHRDPNTMTPITSTSATEGAARTIKIGKFVIPLSGGAVKNLRKGRAFWTELEDRGIETTVFKVPANYPPVDSKGKSLSGMGTPDLLGSDGTFSFYTDDPPANRDEISGGVVYPVEVVNDHFQGKLVGPKNAFLESEPDVTIPFDVWRDPEYATVKIEVQDHQLLLKEKEWSDWIAIDFDLIPGLESVSGICRFYVKEVRPKMRVYVTPINIDPSDPALPVSTPESYAQDLYHDFGYFYTQGMPEDTKALTWGVFDYDDFHSQGNNVLDERIRLFDYVLDGFEDGFLFFYFSSTDLNAHMFYNMIDPDHPSYDPANAEKYGDVIPSIYESVDGVVGKVLARADENTTIILMSDHGFAPFRRAVHLNTWLKDEGYITLVDESKQEESKYFLNVDWARTRAYGLGFNGLYLNLRGREMYGSVTRREKAAILDEITEKLLALRDPKNGDRVVLRVYRSEEVYSGVNMEYAPDLVVGFNRGYRASSETALGEFPKEWIEDNMDAWSGDHMMAAELVPGILLSNKKIRAKDPKLYDLAPTILSEFGVEKNSDMVGESIF